MFLFFSYEVVLVPEVEEEGKEGQQQEESQGGQ